VTAEVGVGGVSGYRNKMTLEMCKLEGIGRKIGLKRVTLN
jgi:hypothetical protein